MGLEEKLCKEAERYENEKEELTRRLQNEKIQQEQENQIRLKQNEDEKNEILQLYENMKRENYARKRENEELRELLSQEKDFLFSNFSRGNSEVKDLLEKE